MTLVKRNKDYILTSPYIYRISAKISLIYFAKFIYTETINKKIKIKNRKIKK